MKKIIYIFWLIFIVTCNDNSSFFQNLNIANSEIGNSSENSNSEIINDNIISK